jgi:hypothetical protein
VAKDGSAFFSGNLSRTAKFIILKNKNKQGPDDGRPDLHLCLAPRETKGQTQLSGQTGSAGSSGTEEDF